MKLPRFIPPCLAAGIVASMVSLAPQMSAAADSAESAAATGTNAAPAFSVSVFDITSSPVKDPFYPHSTRRTANTIATNVTSLVSASTFSLKGLSGSAGHRLALINNRTLAIGETAEITTAAGNRVKIRCVEIREDSVIIHAENQSETIELRFEDRARGTKFQY